MDALASVVTLTPAAHVSRAHCGLLLPACHQGVYARLRRAMEKVGMRGRTRVSERVEAPPHRAEIGFSSLPCRPLPASGARNATPLRSRSKRILCVVGCAIAVLLLPPAARAADTDPC